MPDSGTGDVLATEALAAAAKRGDVERVREVLEEGVSPDAKDGGGYTPLIHAAARGRLAVVELLLDEGADPFVLDSRIYSSALHRAAQSSVPEVALVLLRHGAPIDLQSPFNGHTPLMDAVWHKRAGVVSALLDAGANLDAQGRLGYTALDIARRDGLEEIVALLERRAAEIRAIEGRQRLMAAVVAGEFEGVRSAIDAGADVDALSPDGFTPLMVAAQQGDARIARILIEAGASARILDPLMRATPGHKAGYRGHAEAARVLVELSDLDLDAQGPYNGYTALHDAVWHGHADVAQILVDAGARLDIEGLDGRTPLDMAVEYGYPEIEAALRAAVGSDSGGER